VKICCIASNDEADRAIAAGAYALGLVSAMPSGPGVISDEAVREIAAHVGSRARTFLLTSRQQAAAVIAQHRAAGTSTLQLVDAMDEGGYAQLREQLPGVELVQVIHVTGPESVHEAVAAAAQVDAILLDSGNPAAAVKELGGTGRAHDWQLSAQIRAAVDVPLYLAGGLRAHNVAEAIKTVRPFGLDLCTGVRRDGQLDDAKLAEFMAAVRAAA
jgi:phosphoribosylanthranilate isomerase